MYIIAASRDQGNVLPPEDRETVHSRGTTERKDRRDRLWSK